MARTELPEVTIALPSDEAALMAMCRRLHEENGLFSFDEDKVRETMRKCYLRQRVSETPVIVGVIRNKDGVIEASTCLSVSDFYYSQDWHLAELWNFVDAPYRKSRNAEALVEFGKSCADKMAIPFFTGIITNKRMAGKVRLYQRLLGYPAGAFFIYNGKWKSEPVADHSELRRRLREASHACKSEAKAKEPNGAFLLTANALRDRLAGVAELLREAAEAVGTEDDPWNAAKSLRVNGADRASELAR